MIYISGRMCDNCRGADIGDWAIGVIALVIILFITKLLRRKKDVKLFPEGGK